MNIYWKYKIVVYSEKKLNKVIRIFESSISKIAKQVCQIKVCIYILFEAVIVIMCDYFTAQPLINLSLD